MTQLKCIGFRLEIWVPKTQFVLEAHFGIDFDAAAAVVAAAAAGAVAESRALVRHALHRVPCALTPRGR